MSQQMLGPVWERARSSPAADALVDARSTRSWGALADELLLAAGGMAGPGRWGVLGENTGPTLVAHAAGLVSGCGTVAMSRQLTTREIVQQGQDAAVVGLVCGESSVPAASAAAAELGVPLVVHGARVGDLPAGAVGWVEWLVAQTPLDRVSDVPAAPMLVFTSGTTGRARATQVRWLPRTPASAADYLDELRDRPHLPAGTHLVVGPLQHNGPLVAVRHLLGGEPVVVQQRFDAAAALSAVGRHHVSSTVMVPTHFQRILALPEATRAAADVSSLRMVAHTGAGCPEPVKRAMIAWWGPVLVESYGGSESGTLCRIGSAEWLEHPNSVGRPVPPFEVVVVGADGAEAATGTPGRLGFHHPPERAISYVGDPAKTAAACLSPGVLTLGDIGHVDADGFVYVTDRESDMVLSGGVNLYPSEAEIALSEHPSVTDVAVVGIPDPDLGEQLLAFVVTNGAVSGDELETWCRRGLAAYKVPRRYEFVTDLPRNEMQKIDKRALRGPYWADLRVVTG